MAKWLLVVGVIALLNSTSRAGSHGGGDGTIIVKEMDTGHGGSAFGGAGFAGGYGGGHGGSDVQVFQVQESGRHGGGDFGGSRGGGSHKYTAQIDKTPIPIKYKQGLVTSTHPISLVEPIKIAANLPGPKVTFPHGIPKVHNSAVTAVQIQEVSDGHGGDFGDGHGGHGEAIVVKEFGGQGGGSFGGHARFGGGHGSDVIVKEIDDGHGGERGFGTIGGHSQAIEAGPDAAYPDPAVSVADSVQKIPIGQAVQTQEAHGEEHAGDTKGVAVLSINVQEAQGNEGGHGGWEGPVGGGQGGHDWQ